MPTTKSGTRAVTINSTGGANSWAKGGGTIANSRAISIVVPPHTALHSNTHTFSSAFTNTVWSNWGRMGDQDDGPSGYRTVSSDITVNYGNYSSSFSGAMTNVGNVNTSVGIREISGPWHLAWYVSSGSGISVTGDFTTNANFSGWSQGRHVPGYWRNPLISAAPTGAVDNYQGPSVGAGNNTRTRSISLTGSTGSSGCTVRIVMYYRINDPIYAAWMPNLHSITGVTRTSNQTNTRVPSDGEISLNVFNLPGNPSP